MQWYHYFSGFLSGMFFTNFSPHFVKGVCGDAFPTPFAKPPGKGLSSPVINILWALFNLVMGYLLLRLGKVSMSNNISVIIFFAGIACISLMSAKIFSTKHTA